MPSTYLPKNNLKRMTLFHGVLSCIKSLPSRQSYNINSILPLFPEKAATLLMVKCGMNILKEIINPINLGQITVMAFDQPLFALVK